jgi:hypothetical protein
MATNLGGDAPLPNFLPTNPEGQEWTERLLARFDLTYKLAASKVAAINLIPYRSNQRRPCKDRHMADRLSSVRLMRNWARHTLFPAAEAGERVVVCMRSTRWFHRAVPFASWPGPAISSAAKTPLISD